MRIAYLILVHRNPLLLRRMIGRLSSPESAFFVHIDQKVDITQFSGLVGENVFFSEGRVPVYWAEFSQVHATMLMVRQALRSKASYDYFVFLQGSDYPLKGPTYIHAFLKENRGSEFISLVKMPAPGKPISRINAVRYPSDKRVRRFGFRMLAKVGLGQRDHRKYLRGLEAYSGEACWALSRDACEYISAFMAREPYIEAYFQNTFVPEEMFFHTILGNSPFKDRIRRNLVYADWSAPGAHPAMINEQHVRLFEAEDRVWRDDMFGRGEALFARKFTDDRLDLVDRIDEMIRREEAYVRASSK